MFAKSKNTLSIVASLVLCGIIACSITIVPDDDGISGTVTIANKTFTFKLGATGIFEIHEGGQTVQNKGIVQPLFSDPEDTPESGVITIDSDDVDVIPLGAGKSIVAAQTITGSAELDVYIAPASSTDPCTEGIYIGSLMLTFNEGVVSIDTEGLTLPPAALAEVIKGTFSICLEMAANVSVRITIDGMDIIFGPPVDVAECIEDDDCATGEICVMEECVPETTPECVFNSDCATGEICVNGECLSDITPECVFNSDCALGETCVNGECVADTTPECTLSSDCATGEICVDGECVSDITPECTLNSDCAVGEICMDGECVADVTSDCSTDGDCAVGEVCQDGQCVDAVDDGMYPGAIEYKGAITSILNVSDVDNWAPEAEGRGIGGLTANADGTKVGFTVTTAVLGDNIDWWHIYAMNGDGTGLADLTSSLPVDIEWGLSFPQMNDSGSRLFFRTPLYGTWHETYYIDVAAGSCNLAVTDMWNSGGHKPYAINGAGTRVYYKHEGGYDASDRYLQGLFYADVGATPVLLMHLDELPDPGATWMNMINPLGVSSDGSVVLFVWNEDYWGGDATAMWKVSGSSAPARAVNETHTYVYEMQDMPHRIVTPDGSQALFRWTQDNIPHLDLVDLATGAKTPIVEGTAFASLGQLCISADGNIVRYQTGGAYMIRHDLRTGEIRDTLSEFTAPGLDLWPPRVSNLAANGRYYFVGTTTADIYRIDMEPDSGSFGAAPNVTRIAFSAASLPNDGVTEITVTATVTDAQGLGNIESVTAVSIVDGIENPSWLEDNPPLNPNSTELYDDGTNGDEVAGDGVYTYNRFRTDTYSNFFEQRTLPYDVGVRVVVKDVNENYVIADTVLTITD